MTRRPAILANILLSLPMAAGLLGAAPTASAQTNEMTVTIPFTFSIGDLRLPASSYSVKQVSSYALEVRDNKTRKSIFLMVKGEDKHDAVSRGRLVFERAGNGTYLTHAMFAGTNRHFEAVAKPKWDLDYAKQNAAAPPAIEVAAK
jgi:hypothetical protein